MNKNELQEIVEFVILGGKLLLAFVLSLAFWLLIFYKLGFLWAAGLFILHILYEKLVDNIYG